jgi:hypothetical protein
MGKCEKRRRIDSIRGGHSTLIPAPNADANSLVCQKHAPLDSINLNGDNANREVLKRRRRMVKGFGVSAGTWDLSPASSVSSQGIRVED